MANGTRLTELQGARIELQNRIEVKLDANMEVLIDVRDMLQRMWKHMQGEGILEEDEAEDDEQEEIGTDSQQECLTEEAIQSVKETGSEEEFDVVNCQMQHEFINIAYMKSTSSKFHESHSIIEENQCHLSYPLPTPFLIAKEDQSTMQLVAFEVPKLKQYTSIHDDILLSFLEEFLYHQDECENRSRIYVASLSIQSRIAFGFLIWTWEIDKLIGVHVFDPDALLYSYTLCSIVHTVVFLLRASWTTTINDFGYVNHLMMHPTLTSWELYILQTSVVESYFMNMQCIQHCSALLTWNMKIRKLKQGCRSFEELTSTPWTITIMGVAHAGVTQAGMITNKVLKSKHSTLLLVSFILKYPCYEGEIRRKGRLGTLMIEGGLYVAIRKVITIDLGSLELALIFIHQEKFDAYEIHTIFDYGLHISSIIIPLNTNGFITSGDKTVLVKIKGTSQNGQSRDSIWH
ncbi:uncharacterized protein G2W53_001208 [Senna tora]|uniref:Uncharacterized protein n=1 Tax=Senna tora TaxID=362788 RepID=A0A834XJ96_9FABA|nr:uncharacterized protein G2W53_001208 [Senna tora]